MATSSLKTPAPPKRGRHCRADSTGGVLTRQREEPPRAAAAPPSACLRDAGALVGAVRRRALAGRAVGELVAGVGGRVGPAHEHRAAHEVVAGLAVHAAP